VNAPYFDVGSKNASFRVIEVEGIEQK